MNQHHEDIEEHKEKMIKCLNGFFVNFVPFVVK